MNAAELEAYLHEHIPLSRAMQVSVTLVQPDAVVLLAPLAPNINHRDTVFGGSASALAILAAWSLLHTRMFAVGIASRLVIQRNSMRYERPMAGEFNARSSLAEGASWERFVATLQRRGMARIAVHCVLAHAGGPAGSFDGEFVAMGLDKAEADMAEQGPA